MLAPSLIILNTADLTYSSAVRTDEGNKAAQFFGFEEAFTDVPDAVNGVVGKVIPIFSVTSCDHVLTLRLQIDNATREETSGKFLAFDDTPLAW
jgi:hypothetical protein